MKQLIFILIILVVLVSCTNSKKEKERPEDKRISLRADTLNVVNLTDTMVIYESTCRGCAYEQSTQFDIADSLGVVKLNNIITADNNPSNMAGGNISKTLVLVPMKSGLTKIKMYKFMKLPATAEDSARYTSYAIEVRN